MLITHCEANMSSRPEAGEYIVGWKSCPSFENLWFWLLQGICILILYVFLLVFPTDYHCNFAFFVFFSLLFFTRNQSQLLVLLHTSHQRFFFVRNMMARYGPILLSLLLMLWVLLLIYIFNRWQMYGHAVWPYTLCWLELIHLRIQLSQETIERLYK